mmetsp:Transcript_29166/g.86761  ORF Transcript_29166/g.86761 Transcript_29166/m.86761 type:complete len:123 (+) Transcript_29166:936-1304(+)
MARFLRFRPPPQLAVHADQSAHRLHWQSERGHMPSLPTHGRTSSKGPSQPSLCHASGFEIFLERVLVPLPQFTEHPDHADHSSSWQSTLQGATLQAFSSLSELLGQLPPCLGGAIIVRVRSA